MPAYTRAQGNDLLGEGPPATRARRHPDGSTSGSACSSDTVDSNNETDSPVADRTIGARDGGGEPLNGHRGISVPGPDRTAPDLPHPSREQLHLHQLPCGSPDLPGSFWRLGGTVEQEGPQDLQN